MQIVKALFEVLGLTAFTCGVFSLKMWRDSCKDKRRREARERFFRRLDGEKENSSGMNNIPRPDCPNATKVYEHYGAAGDYERIKSGEYTAIDSRIFREEELKEVTANMAGFGTAKSQRVIIDYDKDYGWFMVKRIPMDYGTEHASAKGSCSRRSEVDEKEDKIE